MKERYDWIDLWSAFYWMRETFPFSIFNHESAFKNALLSHEVPSRGKAYLSAYQRIEKNITADTEFSVTANVMRTNAVSFEAVQIDRPSFEAWIRSNAIEYSAAEARSSNHETSARRATPKMTKLETVITYIKEKYPDGGIPAGVTYKEIAQGIERSRGIRIDVRTVSRALGRK